VLRARQGVVLYGDDKTREMSRSILPARGLTARWARKQRACVHRWSRHRAASAMRALSRDPSAWDEGLDEPDVMQREIGGMVRGRRGGDKLNHFERWAVERTREMPAEVRLDHLAALLPPGLIGDHAFGHLESRRELMSEAQYEARFPWRGPRARPRTSLDRGEAAVLLRKLLELPEAHRALNRALKELVEHERAKNRRELPLRVLHGVHDVVPFLRALEDWRAAPLKQVVDDFLRRLKR
jgi:hypothetical protein